MQGEKSLTDENKILYLLANWKGFMCHPPWLSRLSPRQAMVYMTCRVNHTLRISAYFGNCAMSLRKKPH